MDLAELLLGGALAAMLFGLAGLFAVRQVQTLKAVRAQPDLPREDRRHHVRQAGRRIVCAVLMAVFATMIIGWFFVQRLIPQPDPVEVEAGRPPPVVEFIAYYWIAALLVLFGLLALAVVDFLATARFGLRQQRSLAKEHQAILEKEAARLRQERERKS